MNTTQTIRPTDLSASIARVIALATSMGVTGSELDHAEAKAMWTLARDGRLLARLGVTAANQLTYEVKDWATKCLAVQAELVAIFAGEIEHTEAVKKAAAMVRRAAR